MNDQILQEISAFCRQRGLAESTFGRRAVNDGKLANRLRNGGRITTDTLERIRSFMTRNADAAPARRRVLFDASPPAALPVVKPAAPPGATAPRPRAAGCPATRFPPGPAPGRAPPPPPRRRARSTCRGRPRSPPARPAT